MLTSLGDEPMKFRWRCDDDLKAQERTLGNPEL